MSSSAAAPELAEFGAELSAGPPAYLATVRDDGVPRVHPVTPIIGDGHLFLFMEPTSPKARDLDEQGSYAMHNGVPDANGTGRRVLDHGDAEHGSTTSRCARSRPTASRYSPADRYVLFELQVTEARCNGYGDVELPEPAALAHVGRTDVPRLRLAVALLVPEPAATEIDGLAASARRSAARATSSRTSR